MKRNMPSYITALSDNNFDILEDIIINKYQKFIQLYCLISAYSDWITSLSYKETKHDVLKVDITIAKLKLDDVLSEINENILDNSNILVWKEKKVIHIEITKDESVVS